jgi:hypothetical protein
VTIAVSASKDGKLRVVYGGSDDAKVVLPDEVLELRASSHGGGGADLTPPLGEALTPPENRTPLLTPLVFHQLEVPLTCIEPCIFRPRF